MRPEEEVHAHLTGLLHEVCLALQELRVHFAFHEPFVLHHAGEEGDGSGHPSITNASRATRTRTSASARSRPWQMSLASSES